MKSDDFDIEKDIKTIISMIKNMQDIIAGIIYGKIVATSLGLFK